MNKIEMLEQRRERYRRRKRQGMQDLRVMCLLFLVGLFCYTCANGYVVLQLQNTIDELLKWYCIYAIGTLLCWCIPIYMLWHFHRIGRWVFIIFACASIYLYRDSVQFLFLEIEKNGWYYTFLILFLGKCLGILWVMMRLLLSSNIACIWSMEEMFDDELEDIQEEDEALEEELPPLVQKARKKLRHAAMGMALLLYASLLCIFILLSVLLKIVPAYELALRDIQMILFTQCLFSAMLWSVPMIAMYLGMTKYKVLLCFAMIAELLRMCVSIRDYQVIFQNQDMPFSLQMLYVMVTLLRYFILLKFILRVTTNPLLKAYQKGKIS